MRQGQRALGAIIIAATALLASPAAAQNDPAFRTCLGDDGASIEQRISACSAIIAAGKETPQVLAIAYNYRGGAYYYSGDPVRAIADYDQSIRINPTYYHAFNNRCWARAVIGQAEQAAADCTKVLELLNITNTFENRGFAYLKMGEFDRAIADYETGLRLDPPNKADFLYGRGLAKLKKGDAGGNADVAAAKAIKPGIAEDFASYGVK